MFSNTKSDFFGFTGKASHGESMQKIIIGLLVIVVSAGCLSIKTSHTVTPIGIGDGNTADTMKKTHENFVGLCSDKGSTFWSLPIKEQEQISGLVFSNTRNAYNIKSIKLSLLGGEPFEIEMLLYDKYKVWGYDMHEVLIFNFFRDQGKKWVLLERSILDVD